MSLDRLRVELHGRTALHASDEQRIREQARDGLLHGRKPVVGEPGAYATDCRCGSWYTANQPSKRRAEKELTRHLLDVGVKYDLTTAKGRGLAREVAWHEAVEQLIALHAGDFAQMLEDRLTEIGFPPAPTTTGPTT